jgi:hypothetical protein
MRQLHQAVRPDLRKGQLGTDLPRAYATAAAAAKMFGPVCSCDVHESEGAARQIAPAAPNLRRQQLGRTITSPPRFFKVPMSPINFTTMSQLYMVLQRLQKGSGHLATISMAKSSSRTSVTRTAAAAG